MPLKVLDCTLRDGGYYNNWDFPPELVRAYLHSVGEAGIDLVEIGFRYLPQDGFLGAYAYCTDSFLETLPVPEGVRLGVMVNAADILSHPDGALAAIDGMFDKAANSPVHFVRVAAHFQEVDGLEAAIGRLKELGYILTINLMRAGRANSETLAEAARKVHSWDKVDVLYFADSLGNMTPITVHNTVETLRSQWSGQIGIHTHDNMGRAITNSLAAIDTGVTWLDGTITGMGRGAGNAQTEYLLIELNQRGLGDYHVDALFPLALNEFEILKNKYGWGTRLLYYLSGAYDIHPTYVQEILRNGTYSSEHAIAAIKTLQSMPSDSYRFELLQESLTPRNMSFPGTWSATGWAKNRPLLMIGAGPWVRENMDSILHFIDRVDPVVVCLNTNLELPDGKTSAFAACHIFRFVTEADHYLDLQAPIIAPMAALPEQVRKKLEPVQILDYGLTVESERFSAEETGCVIPRRFAAAYVMALANAAGASRILLAGFDGYTPNDPLQQEMEHIFKCYHDMPGAIPLLSVTPTTYSIQQSSVFAPEI